MCFFVCARWARVCCGAARREAWRAARGVCARLDGVICDAQRARGAHASAGCSCALNDDAPQSIFCAMRARAKQPAAAARAPKSKMHTRRLPGGRGVTGTAKAEDVGGASAAAVPGGACGGADDDAFFAAAATDVTHQAKPNSASARAMRTHTAVEELRALKLCPRHLFVFLGWSDAEWCADSIDRHNKGGGRWSGAAERSAPRCACSGTCTCGCSCTQGGKRRQRRRTAMRGAACVRSRPPRRCLLSC
jgi:hypothetical protein